MPSRIQNHTMNNALVRIFSNVGLEHLSSSYRREGCRISMDGIPSERILVDMDSVFRALARNERHCDFVLFYIDEDGQCVAVPLELKGRHVKVSTSGPQLEQGVQYVDRVVPADVRIQCIPILVHRGSIHRLQRNRLVRHRIQFRGESLAIGTTRCNRRRNLARTIGKMT